MKKRILTAGLLTLTLALLILSNGWQASAAPPNPRVGLADVDGDSSEWILASDFFADLYLTGDANNPVYGKLYLRYDCQNNVLYLLVRLTTGVLNTSTAGEHWVNIDGGGKEVLDSTGDDGVVPDFAFLAGGDSNAPGWEASVSVSDASHTLSVHTLSDNTGGGGNVDETVQTDKDTGNPKKQAIDLVPDCPTAIELLSFDVAAGTGTGTITWETGTEIDNAGFNLYRSTSPDGPWVKINSNLILAEGDPVMGASYTFIDTPGRGTYYYYLEDVDFYGLSTPHEALMADLGPVIRRPWYRPFLSWLGF